MNESFFEPVDDNSYRVFYDQRSKNLRLPSEYTSDPITHTALVVVGKYPDPRLHGLFVGVAQVSYYCLDFFGKGIQLKHPFTRWILGELRWEDVRALLTILRTHISTNMISMTDRVVRTLLGPSGKSRPK